MEEREIFNKGEFNQWQMGLLQEANKLFGINSFSISLSNRLLTKLMKQTVLNEESLPAANELLRIEVDEYLKELQLYCYKYALKLIKDPETAQDITQMAMQEMFKSMQQIEAIKGWLHSTVYNLAMTAIKLKGRDRELIRELTAQKSMYYDPQKLEKVELEKVLSEEQVKELLTEDDYSRFLEINKHNSLKEYAEKTGISYGTAKKHSHIIRRDLKAAYLRKMGWKAKPEILTYRQYDNLRRFVHRLLEYSNKNEMKRLNRYCLKIDYHQVEDVLMQINQIDDWGVRYLSENNYYLTLWDKDKWQIAVLMTISVPPDQAISILTCKTVKCMKRMKNKYNKKIPLNKGLIALKFEELVEYMSKP